MYLLKIQMTSKVLRSMICDCKKAMTKINKLCIEYLLDFELFSSYDRVMTLFPRLGCCPSGDLHRRSGDSCFYVVCMWSFFRSIKLLKARFSAQLRRAFSSLHIMRDIPSRNICPFGCRTSRFSTRIFGLEIAYPHRWCATWETVYDLTSVD